MKPGYKQTEVGVIPEEWETHRLGELLQGPRSIRYGIVQPGKFDATGCYMLRSQDYSKGWAGPDGMHKVSAQLENQYRNARILHNDLVITVVGAGIGQVVVVPQWLDGAILSRSTARVAIDEDKAARSFVRACLEGPLGKRQILDCQKEGAQPVVSCIDLAKFFVAYPPLPEQRAIATALSDVDGLLGGLDRLIAKKRDLKQAAMQQLLTGQTRLPGFHGEWEVKRLGDVITHCFSGATPRRNRPDFYKGNIRWITSGELNYNVITDTIEKISTEAVAETNLTIHPVGTFLMAITGLEAEGTRGACGIVGAPSTTNQSCMAVFPTAALAGEFLFHYYVFRGKSLALQYCQGTKQQSYTASLVKQLPIDLPPTLPEQTAIASVLSEMDAELAALTQRREKTRALKQAMMQELLTGRTRLISTGVTDA